MKKIMLIASLFSAGIITAQTVTPKVSFVKGQLLEQNSQVKVNMVQEMMGQSMDFNIETNTKSHYEIKDASSNSFSIANTVKRVAINMSGAGQERQFDSDKKEDLDGQMGAPFKNRIGKTTEFTINNQGIVTSVKDTAEKLDEAMGMMGTMSGSAGEMTAERVGTRFRALSNIPAKGVKVGDTWVDSTGDIKNRVLTSYTLKSVSGNEAVVSLTGTSLVNKDVEQGSMAMHIEMKGESTGECIFDLVSGIVSNMKSVTKSTGTVEVMGQSVPLKMESSIVATISKK